MAGTHFIAMFEPVDRAMQLVEMQELVEAADATFRHLARIVNVEAIDGRIEASSRAPRESIKILNTQQFDRLFEERVVVQSEEMRTPEIAVAGNQFGEKRQLGCDPLCRGRGRGVWQ